MSNQRKSKPAARARCAPAPCSVRASDPLKPSVGVLIKLGSAIIHIEEMQSYRFDPREHAYTFDLAALSQTLDDPEVKEWLTQMSKMGFMPVKR